MSLASTLTPLQAWIEKSSDDVVSRYVRLLRQDPSAVAVWFRRLYNARTRRGRNTDIELYQLSECLARTHEMRTSRGELPEGLAFLRTGGVALIVSAGLPKVYIDVVRERGFLDEDPQWTCNIVKSLTDIIEMCIGQACRNATLTDMLLGRSDAMWDALWAGRRALARDVDVLAEEELRTMLAVLIRSYHGLYAIRKRKTSLESSPALFLVFFIWYHAPPERLTICLEVFYLFTARHIESVEACRWTQRAALREFGTTKTVDRFNRELEDPKMLNQDLLYLFHMWRIVTRHPEIGQVAAYGTTYKSIAVAVRRQGEVGDPQLESRILPWAVPFIKESVEHNPISACLAPLIQRYELFKIMANGAMICAVNNCPAAETKVCMDLITTTCHCLAGPSTPKGKTRLRHALKKAAREKWMSTLFILQQKRPSNSEALALYQLLMTAWMHLGGEAGLSMTSESERYRKKTLNRMCYNQACEFHSQTIPPHLMMKCKGCRSTQYCDCACQKRHWYEGGHREKCKRWQGRC